MSSARLRPLPFDRRRVALSPEEGYVLSRLDRPVLRSEIPALVGMNAAQADAIVTRLVAAGVLALEGEAATAARPSDRPSSGTRRRGSTAGTPGAWQPLAPRAPSGEQGRSGPPSLRRPSDASRLAGDRPSCDGGLRPSAPPVSIPGEAMAARERWESTLRPLAATVRASRAQLATGDDLLALCHDPHPQVVLALLANAAFRPGHARIVAHFHQNASGLELLARNDALLGDAGVQRSLLGNPRLTAALLDRVLAVASLEDLHQHATDPGLGGELRRRLAEAASARFAAATSRERAELVYWSEGRALQGIGGVPLDEETATLIAERPITSAELVTRLATYPGTPRSLLVALDRQPFVVGRRDLRELIRQHPSARHSTTRA